MKTCLAFGFLSLLGLALIAGCEKKSDVNTTSMESSFKTADPDTRSASDKAIDAVKKGDYQGALVQLQALVSNLKLTPEQQDSVKSVMAQVRDKLAGAAKGIGDKAKDATSDLQKKLGQ